MGDPGIPFFLKRSVTYHWFPGKPCPCSSAQQLVLDTNTRQGIYEQDATKMTQHTNKAPLNRAHAAQNMQ